MFLILARWLLFSQYVSGVCASARPDPKLSATKLLELEPIELLCRTDRTGSGLLQLFLPSRLTCCFYFMVKAALHAGSRRCHVLCLGEIVLP